MATPAQRQKEPGRVLPAPGARGSSSSGLAELGHWHEALRLILAPLAKGEGFRHGAFGAPGAGKTHGIRWVIAAALRYGAADLAFSHDVKGRETEFPEGTPLRSVLDVTGERLAELDKTRHAVVRGDALVDDDELPVEPVALAARRLLRLGIPILLNVGELDACLSDGGRAWTAPTVRWFSSQGRKLRGSLVWTTQQPKRVPDEVIDQSTTVAFHRLEARSLNYIASTLMLDTAMVAILPRLARGEFVLWTPGADWNGRVYLFPGSPPPAPSATWPELVAA